MQARSFISPVIRRWYLVLMVVTIVLVAAPAALAASGDLSWSLTADSPPHWNDSALAVAPGPDGTVYAAGNWADWVPMFATSDLTLVRLRPATSAAGAVVWQRTWDDPLRHRADWFGALVTDPAGNAIVAGTSSVSDTDSDIVIIKWRPNGKRAWTGRYGSPYQMSDYPADVACDGKGNVYVAAYRYLNGNDDGDWLVMKFRGTDGKRLWVRAWSGTEMAVSEDRPAGLVVDAAGYSYSVGISDDANGVHDAIVMKRTPGGKLAWLRRVDRSPYGSDEAQRIALAGDRLYVAGVAEDLAVQRLLALKYGTGGKRLWTRTWDLPQAELGGIRDFVVDRAGNAVAVGRAVRDERGHALVVSWSSAGELRWSDVSVPNVVATATADAVVVNRAGTVWVAGSTSLNSSGRLLKYSSTGARIWAKYLDLDGSTRTYFHGLCLWGTGSLAVAGSSTSDETNADLLVAKYVR